MKIIKTRIQKQAVDLIKGVFLGVIEASFLGGLRGITLAGVYIR